MSLSGHFRPILHLILLIWKSSVYYNSPSRLVILIREICNTIIKLATAFLDGDTLFNFIDQVRIYFFLIYLCQINSRNVFMMFFQFRFLRDNFVLLFLSCILQFLCWLIGRLFCLLPIIQINVPPNIYFL